MSGWSPTPFSLVGKIRMVLNRSFYATFLAKVLIIFSLEIELADWKSTQWIDFWQFLIGP